MSSSSGPAAAAAAPPVSVQLTPIAPVRVFDVHGEYFDTELDIDAPLRALQLAIEDYFKMKPEVQLLLHNRQQVHPDRTLRDNGCLLLKGDPYVKLVCLLKRGPVLNLQCEVGPVTYVIACHETATVWEVKGMLCDEMQRQQRRAAPQDGEDGAAGRRLACGPERLRLLWRYMELNDKATLHYYRIATNAVLHVMHRRRAVAAPHESRAASRDAAGRGRAVVASSSPAAAAGPSPASATVWWQRPPPPVEYHDAFADLGPLRQPTAAPPPPLPPPPPQPATYAPPQAAPAVPPTAPPPPPLRSDPLTSAEAASLSHAVRSLEAQLHALRQEQRHVEAHQQSLSAHQRGSLADAQQRILELEETVLRFHALLQRAVALLPAS